MTSMLIFATGAESLMYSADEPAIHRRERPV
jgi:hypothetical protein